MRIQSARYLELPAELRTQIDEAAWTEFERYAIVRETEWATPDWTFLAFEDDELVAYYNIVDRTVRIDSGLVRVAGLNNMVTMPAHRGRGYASRLLRETQPQWFSSRGVDAGLLLCADALLPFYSRLEWRKTSGSVVYSQPDGPRTWTASCMLLDPRARIPVSKPVDLCGLPW